MVYLPRRKRSAIAEMPRVHQPRSRSLARTVRVLMVPACGRSGSASMTQISSAVTSCECDSLTVYITILPAGSDHSILSVPVRYSPPEIFLTHSGASFAAKNRRYRIAHASVSVPSDVGFSGLSSKMSTRRTSGIDGWGPCDRSLNAAITTETCSSYLNTTVFSMPPLEADISRSSAKDSATAIVVSEILFQRSGFSISFRARRWDVADARAGR